jgi:hypothetical protein
MERIAAWIRDADVHPATGLSATIEAVIRTTSTVRAGP